MPGESAFTLSAVRGDKSVALDTCVVDALAMMARIACAVGDGLDISIEKVPVEGDEETNT